MERKNGSLERGSRKALNNTPKVKEYKSHGKVGEGQSEDGGPNGIGLLISPAADQMDRQLQYKNAQIIRQRPETEYGCHSNHKQH